MSGTDEIEMRVYGMAADAAGSPHGSSAKARTGPRALVFVRDGSARLEQLDERRRLVRGH